MVDREKTTTVGHGTDSMTGGQRSNRFRRMQNVVAMVTVRGDSFGSRGYHDVWKMKNLNKMIFLLSHACVFHVAKQLNNIANRDSF